MQGNKNELESIQILRRLLFEEINVIYLIVFSFFVTIYAYFYGLDFSLSKERLYNFYSFHLSHVSFSHFFFNQVFFLMLVGQKRSINLIELTFLSLLGLTISFLDQRAIIGSSMIVFYLAAKILFQENIYQKYRLFYLFRTDYFLVISFFLFLVLKMNLNKASIVVHFSSFFFASLYSLFRSERKNSSLLNSISKKERKNSLKRE